MGKDDNFEWEYFENINDNFDGLAVYFETVISNLISKTKKLTSYTVIYIMSVRNLSLYWELNHELHKISKLKNNHWWVKQLKNWRFSCWSLIKDLGAVVWLKNWKLGG
jgi:hypothetical protein